MSTGDSPVPASHLPIEALGLQISTFVSDFYVDSGEDIGEAGSLSLFPDWKRSSYSRLPLEGIIPASPG